jgi:cytochrome c-type protein NapB
MKKTLRLALMALATSAFCITVIPTAISADSVDSAVKSMRGIDTQAADIAPDEKSQLGKKPGSQKTVSRSFEQQPPVIPHATENFDEITLEENQCLSCHDVSQYKKKNAPKIGDSHFRSQQTGEVMKQMSSARHNCVQCHVPQVDAPPLVENTFKSVPATKKK